MKFKDRIDKGDFVHMDTLAVLSGKCEDIPMSFIVLDNTDDDTPVYIKPLTLDETLELIEQLKDCAESLRGMDRVVTKGDKIISNGVC